MVIPAWGASLGCAGRSDSAYKGNADVVIMRDRSYFFTEGDGCATIDVMRLGDCTGQVEVGYSTVGKGGDDFTEVKGVLIFEPKDTNPYLRIYQV